MVPATSTASPATTLPPLFTVFSLRLPTSGSPVPPAHGVLMRAYAGPGLRSVRCWLRATAAKVTTRRRVERALIIGMCRLCLIML